MIVRFVLVLAVMAVALSALWVLALVWRRGRVRRRPILSAMLVASFLYAFGYGLELAGDSVDWKLTTFWIQHLGITFAPALLATFAGQYAFGRFLHARPTRWALFGLSAASYLLVVTGRWHELYHLAPRLDTAGPFPVLAFDRGPWYLGFHLYVAVALLVSNAAFLRAWLRAPATRRKQARTLMLASLVPWAFSLAYLVGWVPWGVDASPFALAFTAGFFAWGITRHALADVVPIARELVFERMSDPVVVVDVDGRVVDRNAAGAELLAAMSEVPQERGAELDRYPALARAVAASGEDAPREVHVDGRTYGLRIVNLESVRDRPLGRAIVLRDVTSYEEMQWRLRELATTDELTGLPNRRHFLELAERYLAQSRRSGRSVGWIVFDVDHFKRVNDRYGHEAGDRTLRAVTAAASEVVRSSDVIGRMGGEEFAVCLPDADLEGTLALAERLRAAVAELRVAIATGSVSVTVSLGACATSGENLDLDTVLAIADGALYRAKRGGRDRVVTMEPRVPS